MNKVRERILQDIKQFNYKDFNKHKDLIGFCVCSGYFEWNSDTYTDEESDFNELLVVVEKDWLFNHIKMENENIITDEDVRRFLQEEYTSDDILVPLNNDEDVASYEDYYTSDFISLIKSGHIKIVV